jgi:hypothetical protein
MTAMICAELAPISHSCEFPFRAAAQEYADVTPDQTLKIGGLKTVLHSD